MTMTSDGIVLPSEEERSRAFFVPRISASRSIESRSAGGSAIRSIFATRYGLPLA